MIKTVKAKFPGMRNEDDCVVYPNDGSGFIKIQGGRLIGRFNIETGEGVVNCKGSNAKYNLHLIYGAVPATVTKEFIAQCIECQPVKGQHIGGNVYIG